MDGEVTMPVLPVVPVFLEEGQGGEGQGAGGVSTPTGSRSMGSGVSPVSSGVSPVSSGVSPMSDNKRVSEPPEMRNNSRSARRSIWRVVKRWFC